MALTKVSTDGVKDDAITSGKIPANAVGASELADNAVDTNAIANNAVTAGKTSGVQTTITNNADNRIVTGTGTANTLECETNLTYNGNNLTTKGADNSTSANSGGTGLLIQNTNNTNNNQNFLGFYDSTLTASAAIIAQHENHSSTTGNLQFGTRNAGTYGERMRIDSTGKLGIGTTNPNTKLHVQGSVSGGDLEALRLHNNNTATGTKTTLAFTNTTDANVEHAKITATRDNSGRLDFFVGAQSHAVLCVDGYASGVVGVNTVQASFPLDVNGKIRTNSGILFGSDTASANTLDDYEEGTWTPSSSQGMGTIYHASYTKIGRVVHVNFYVNAPTSTSGSGFVINNLPFTLTGGSHYAIGSCYTQNTSTTYVFLQGNQNSTNVNVLKDIGYGVTFSDLSGGYIIGSLTYFAA